MLNIHSPEKHRDAVLGRFRLRSMVSGGVLVQSPGFVVSGWIRIWNIHPPRKRGGAVSVRFRLRSGVVRGRVGLIPLFHSIYMDMGLEYPSTHIRNPGMPFRVGFDYFLGLSGDAPRFRRWMYTRFEYPST